MVAFTKLRKANISFVMSVCLSFMCPHKITWFPLEGFSRNLSVFGESFKKIQVSLKTDKNNGFIT